MKMSFTVDKIVKTAKPDG